MFGFHRHGHDRHDHSCHMSRHGRAPEWAGTMRGGRHGGRRRLFDGDELKLLLLALLGEQPRHGYDLIREIETRSGGAYVPSPGVVYPTLALLDEMALVDELKEDGARKRFALTDGGRSHLEERRGEADRLLARLAELGADRARTDAGPIRRAMANLHMALGDALAADPARAHDIAAILDEAARTIERGAAGEPRS